METEGTGKSSGLHFIFLDPRTNMKLNDLLSGRKIYLFIHSFSSAIRLRAGLSKLQILLKERDFLLVTHVQAGYGTHPACSQYRDTFPRIERPECKVTTYSYLVAKLKVSGAILQLSLYAIMARTIVTLLF